MKVSAPGGGDHPERDSCEAGALAEVREEVHRWRDIARRRRSEAASVHRRPLVRAAIALDRRLPRRRKGPGGPEEPGPSPDAGPSSAARDPDVVAAERAGLRYWRLVAAQREADTAAVRRRPVVRAALALDRRTSRLQRAVGRVASGAGARADRLVLHAGGWLRRRHPAPTPGIPRVAAGEAEDVGTRGPPDRLTMEGSPTGRVVGPPDVLVVDLRPTPVGAVDGPGTGDTSVAGDGHRTVRRERGVDEVSVPWPVDPGARREALRSVDAAVASSAARTVCLIGPATETIRGARARLVRVAERDRVVAGPVVVHPVRPWHLATAHDGLVRAAGLEVAASADGSPALRHVAAGAGATRVVPPQDPTAVTAAALAVDRGAWVAAGGLDRSPVTDLDAAVVDLCLRLRTVGHPIRIVTDALVVDARPIGRRRGLRGPLDDDGRAWRALVERHGPRLVPPKPDERLRMAVSTATPSRKVASTSGDWHYATDLARALRAAGHVVVLQTEEETDDLRGRICDVHLVLRGLEPVRRTEGQAHVLWVISHPEALTVEECDRADLVLVASRPFAEDLRARTSTPVEVMWQATDPSRFTTGPTDPSHRHDVTVVASTRGVRRASVDDALAAGLRPAIHGLGWSGLVDPDLLCEHYVPPEVLPAVYRSAGIVLNDHWETMRRWGFWSNRILDVLACGTPVVSDHVPGLTSVFDDLVPTWRDPDELARTVESLRRDPDATAARVAEARRLVLAEHTFEHRVAQLEALLHDHGLVP